MAIEVENSPQRKYRKTCPHCGTIFTYEQDDIGYRPWYPSGFVYCPKCRKPLRHHPQNDLIKED